LVDVDSDGSCMIHASKRDARSLLEIAKGIGVVTKPPRKSKIEKRELNPTEHVEQSMLIQRLAVQEGKYPELELIYAVPNGGYRSARTAKLMKAEGVKRSVPDLVLPVPRWPFHGMYVEMKRIGWDATDAQLAYHARLREQGYCVVVAEGEVAAYPVVMEYLQLQHYDEGAAAISRHDWSQIHLIRNNAQAWLGRAVRARSKPSTVSTNNG
jgi:hypothetical protein